MNEFLNLLAENLLEFVLAVIATAITCFVIPWAKSTVSPFIKETVIPWLKEKRLYGVVEHFVEAAEKYAENHEIDKKQYVVDLLKDKGIAITPEIEAYIESAVKKLDLSVSEVIDVITDTVTADTDDSK